MSRPETHHQSFWKALGERVQLDDVGDLGRFLGRHHETLKCEDGVRFGFDMPSYAEATIGEYKRVAGVNEVKPASTPFLGKCKKYEDDDEDHLVGTPHESASSILMRLMWLARLARPDLLKATCWLATRVQTWTRFCDASLQRIIGYLVRTVDMKLTGYMGDKKESLFLDVYCDADFCGEAEDCYSTSGGWIELAGEHSAFPLSWTSKKQGSVSRSTTECEIVALAYLVFNDAIALAQLFSELFGAPIIMRIYEDNESTARILFSGYSKQMRHLKRTHKINIASVKEQVDRDDTQLHICPTTKQKADAFTKALEPAKWPAAMRMMGMLEKPYEVVKSTSTGLKLQGELQVALDPNPQSIPQASLDNPPRTKRCIKYIKDVCWGLKVYAVSRGVS